ncbi:MAG: hypothetical protein AB7S70_15745 [Hyphomicrobium sp.]|uniref:hypothetical protein n=1 Tax=Hyphomicrobium sp. TaxID=82 RepID=UPI003D1512EE
MSVARDRRLMRSMIRSCSGWLACALLLTVPARAGEQEALITKELRRCIAASSVTKVTLLDAEGKSPEDKSMIMCEGGSGSAAGALSTALLGLTKQATEVDDQGKERVIQYFGHPQGFEAQCVRYPETFSCYFAVNVKSSMPAEGYLALLKNGSLPLSALPLGVRVKALLEE